jgi:hypothetical protein
VHGNVRLGGAVKAPHRGSSCVSVRFISARHGRLGKASPVAAPSGQFWFGSASSWQSWLVPARPVVVFHCLVGQSRFVSAARVCVRHLLGWSRQRYGRRGPSAFVRASYRLARLGSFVWDRFGLLGQRVASHRMAVLVSHVKARQVPARRRTVRPSSHGCAGRGSFRLVAVVHRPASARQSRRGVVSLRKARSGEDSFGEAVIARFVEAVRGMDRFGGVRRGSRGSAGKCPARQGVARRGQAVPARHALAALGGVLCVEAGPSGLGPACRGSVLHARVRYGIAVLDRLGMAGSGRAVHG